MDRDEGAGKMLESSGGLAYPQPRLAIGFEYGAALEHSPAEYMGIGAHLTPEQSPCRAALVVGKAMLKRPCNHLSLIQMCSGASNGSDLLATLVAPDDLSIKCSSVVGAERSCCQLRVVLPELSVHLRDQRESSLLTFMRIRRAQDPDALRGADECSAEGCEMCAGVNLTCLNRRPRESQVFSGDDQRDTGRFTDRMPPEQRIVGGQQAAALGLFRWHLLCACLPTIEIGVGVADRAEPVFSGRHILNDDCRMGAHICTVV